MEDDEKHLNDSDPKNILPYSKRLEPEDPKVEKLPKAYKGSLGKGPLDGEAYMARNK